MSLRVTYAGALAAFALALSALGAAGAAAGSAAEAQADDLPSLCTDPGRPANVYTWVGGGADHNWSTAANWVAGTTGVHEVPNDYTPTSPPHPYDPTNGIDTAVTIVCIDANDSVVITDETFGHAYVWLQEIYVSGAFTITLKDNNTALFVDGKTRNSTLGPATVVDLRGQLGGRGTIESSGSITATSKPGFPVQLTTKRIVSTVDEQAFTDAGRLVVEAGGSLALAQKGVGLAYNYQLDIGGTVTIRANPTADPATTPYLAASDGSQVNVLAGGKLTFAGNGGLYRGKILSGKTLAPLRNSGTLEKTGAGTVSVVGVDYQPQPGGVVNVVAGDLRLPDGDTSAPRMADQVGSGQTFGTGACAAAEIPADTGASCAPALTASDPRSVALTAPSDGAATNVVLDEDAAGSMPFTGLSGHVVLAGADAATVDRDTPLTVTLRYQASDVAHLPLSSLRMLWVAEGSDVWQVLADCAVPGRVPIGRPACFDRAASAQLPGGDITVVVHVGVGGDSRHIISRVGDPVDAAGAMGTAQVGRTLDAHGVSFAPLPPNAAPTSVAYQWSVDGVPLTGSGPDGSLLALGPGLAGRTVILDVYASHPDWGTGLFSFSAGPVAPGALVCSRPTLAKRARKVTAAAGSCTVATTVAYQWYAKGKPIRGATGKKLKVTSKIRGKKVYVRVTHTSPGYAQDVQTSRRVKVT